MRRDPPLKQRAELKGKPPERGYSDRRQPGSPGFCPQPAALAAGAASASMPGANHSLLLALFILQRDAHEIK